MRKDDTSSEARQVQIDIYRRMPVTEKVRRIFEAYQTGKLLAMAGLRELYPQASERKIWHLWAKQHLGEELFKEVYGEVPE
ncbi:MAG: hypothetical protein ACYTEL_04615 [Planctomycetota bacterium]